MRASQFKNLLADLHSLSSEQLADLRAEADRLHQRTHALGSLDAAMVGAGCPHCNSFKYTKNGLGRGVQRYRCKDCAQTFNAATNTPLVPDGHPNSPTCGHPKFLHPERGVMAG